NNKRLTPQRVAARYQMTTRPTRKPAWIRRLVSAPRLPLLAVLLAITAAPFPSVQYRRQVIAVPPCGFRRAESRKAGCAAPPTSPRARTPAGADAAPRP